MLEQSADLDYVDLSCDTIIYIYSFTSHMIQIIFLVFSDLHTDSSWTLHHYV